MASEKLDKIVNFSRIAEKINNKAVRFIVSAFEIVDYQIFKVSLTEIIELIPEEAHGVVESWLDAFIAEDYFLLVDSTGGFLAQLDLIKIVDNEDEKAVYVAILSALVRLIPKMTNPVEG